MSDRGYLGVDGSRSFSVVRPTTSVSPGVPDTDVERVTVPLPYRTSG